MKVKLLKKLRNIGRGMVNIHSVTMANIHSGTTPSNISIGMSYGHDYDEYSGLFEMGDTEADVKEKASRIYLQFNIEKIRIKYRNYSRLFRCTIS